MTVSRSAWRATLALISIGLLVGGCGHAATSQAASPGASPEMSEAAILRTPPVGSVKPSAASAEPPVASLAVDGGDPVDGELGSYSWQDSGSDAPWLDGRPIHVWEGERLMLTLADPVGVTNWTASRVAPGNRDGVGAIGLGEGSGGPVAFDAPPPGSWSVSVNVWFSDNRGSAAYYWLVDVD